MPHSKIQVEGIMSNVKTGVQTQDIILGLIWGDTAHTISLVTAHYSESGRDTAHNTTYYSESGGDIAHNTTYYSEST